MLKVVLISASFITLNLRHDPTAINPCTLIALPTRPNALILNVDPKFKKSKMLAALPMRVYARIDREDPK
jgi:hypothetical protein